MSENCEHDVKVTFLGKGWGIRVFLNGKINQESFVKHKDEISAEIQRMLRI